MATFRKFEEIDTWRKARQVNLALYRVTREAPLAQDYFLRDQIRRAGISIMANIAKGFGRSSRKEFARFISISMGSVGEVQSHLYVALDLQYIDQATFDELYCRLAEITRMCGSLKYHLLNC